MSFSLYIAKRYLGSKSTNNAINIISIIALVGVILASGALFVVLSGFEGLKHYTLQFTSVANPDLKVETTIGKTLTISPEQFNTIKNIEGVTNISKIIEERVIIRFDNKTYPTAKIKGVDDNYNNVNNILGSIEEGGSWLKQNSNLVVTGAGIARNLGINVLDFGKKINIYVPKPGKGQVTSIKNAFNNMRAINVGVFSINETLNDTYIYAPIDFAKSLLNYNDNQVTFLEIKIEDAANENKIRTQLSAVLGNDIDIKNRLQQNTAIYKMLNTENLAVYLIFTLVMIIALFNIIGSIIMMILDKRENLNTLFNLGASVEGIRRIFFLQGSLMVLLGGTIGLIIGYVLVLLQQQFSMVMLTPSLPYPVDVKAVNFVIVFLTIVILGIIASKIAASRITKDLVKN